MMRALPLMLLLALGACGANAPNEPAPAEPAATAAAGDPCNATAASSWNGGAAQFALEAQAAGPDCTHAMAGLIVRTASGAVVLRESYAVDRVMTLAGAESPADLERRLAEWIAPPGAAFDSTGDLPV